MNKRTKNILRARVAGMASATRGRSRVFVDRKNTNQDDSEIDEGVNEYEERKRKASYYSFRPTRYPLPPLL